MEKIVVDTNILIDSPEILLNGEYEYCIPYIVLSELDRLKKRPELNSAARYAIKILYRQLKDGKLEVVDMPDDQQTNDERIIQSAVDHKCGIMTDDIGARALALLNDIFIHEEDEEDLKENYLGHQTVKGDVDYEKHWVALKEVQLGEIQHKFGVDLAENEYLIIDRIIEKNDIWVNKGGKVTRISQSATPFKDAGILITPLDAIQASAINSVMDATVPLTVIEGRMGSSKTISSLVGALACTIGQKRFKHYKKIYVTRPNIAIDRRLELGFLPGEVGEKFTPWLAGIQSNLSFMFERTDEHVRAGIAGSIFAEHFEMLPLETIQGLSLHDSILLVDEYQLLSQDMLKMVLSRIAQGSKIVLIGDTQSQTYGVNRGIEGFKKIHSRLGDTPLMNYVQLTTIYRSELAEFVDELFN